MALGKLGKYERVDVLGHGATGIVYLAWDTLLKKQVALKEIDLQSADVGRFLEEARVMDRLSHPNIVRVNGVDKIDGHILIDMEYVRGQNLQQLLRREGRLPVGQALDIAIQTLDALEYAHRMRTVHRDIKPANILVGKTGSVKLVDFGLAEILATNSYAGGAGTYAYMAPEDFSEEHHSDHQSDVWAVGVTLYEMLTAARPFNVAKPKDPFAWRRVLAEEPPTPLAEYMEQVPDGLQAVLDMALAADKSQRYRSAGEFRDALAALRDTSGSMAAETRSPAPAWSDAPNGNGHGPIGDRYPSEEYRIDPVSAGNGIEFVMPTLLSPAVQTTATSGAAMAFGQPVEAPPPYIAQTVASKPASGLNLFRRTPTPARVAAWPAALQFGELRKGDDRSERVRLRFTGGERRVSGQVTAAPPWITVDPPVISRRRQTLTVTAHSERVWEIGEFADQIRIQTTAGEIVIPVALRVAKPRPRFAEIAVWYLPAIVAVLLPALTIAWHMRTPGAAMLAPAAALGSSLLAAMLWLTSSDAELNFAERTAAALLLAAMTMVLGVTVGHAYRAHNISSLTRLSVTGLPFGLVLVAQLFRRRYWKLWAAAIIVLGILASMVFLSVLS